LKAVIVGCDGQDGRLLFDKLVSDGWEVIGIGRGSSRDSAGHEADPVAIIDADAVERLMAPGDVDSVFYLPAVHQSSEGSTAPDSANVLFDSSWKVHVAGLINFLETLARHERGSLFYAASSLIFGEPDVEPQNELTPFRPASPYAITKSAGVNVCRYYRETHGMRASAGILYNHESSLRGVQFVSQRIARAAVDISRGSRHTLALGNLSAEVDWGYAPDFVEAMIRIAALPSADDYVIATGEAHSVREFVEIAFGCVGLDWRDHVSEDSSLLGRRDARRVGDSSRLKQATGWRPTVTFAEMVAILIEGAKQR